jgi:predicted membrane metal-binding protein
MVYKYFLLFFGCLFFLLIIFFDVQKLPLKYPCLFTFILIACDFGVIDKKQKFIDKTTIKKLFPCAFF